MRILMVCLGNMCRSPLAEGILRDKIWRLNLDWEVDSAGTGAWHSGENPDLRAISVGRKYGVDISKLVARQFKRSDLDKFDHILVMDKSNYGDVVSLAKNDNQKQKVQLILNYVNPGSNAAVPDPWYGDEMFEEVFHLLDKACEAVVEKLSVQSSRPAQKSLS